jgi:hypothetical protein
MSFISLLTRAQKLESGLNAVKPHTWSHQELNFLLFLTMPRCKGEKVHMAPKFQKLKKQVVVLKMGNTPLVLARESICDGPALLTDETGKIITPRKRSHCQLPMWVQIAYRNRSTKHVGGA